MNNKPENPHAFAFAHSNFNDEWVTSQGMTLRDYFAAKAMQALIAAGAEVHIHKADGVLTLPSKVGIPPLAYEYAEAMLEAREK